MTSIPDDLKDMQRRQGIHHKDEYTNVLGVEWDLVSDSFRHVISCYKDSKPLTKRVLVSNIAHLFVLLGRCSPTIIQMKLLLQRFWEHSLTWGELVPKEIEGVLEIWYKELLLLKEFSVARPCFLKRLL